MYQPLSEFFKVIKPKEWLTNKYEELWQKNYDDSIRIVKRELSADEYYQRGKTALVDYYNEYEPFDHTKIIETEKLIRFPIKQNDKEFFIVGKLDRIDWNDKTKRFEIHDYKASGNLKTQEEADSDDQLTLNQIALMQLWPDAFGARLIWHYLLFNKQIESSRT
jgi:hypothetical protein